MLEFSLLVVALTLLYILLPLLVIYGVIKYIVQDSRLFKIWFFRCAIAIDQLGNVVAMPLFNSIMITGSGHKFGNPDETISSVIGKNYRDGTLTFIGHLLRSTLDFIDENHSLNSIEEDE